MDRLSRIKSQRVRDIFLGFNDGLVELSGAVSGFFAAFSDTSSVLIAGTTVAVAGAFSMAAGAFVATSSQLEVEGKIRRGRSVRSAVVVGCFYLVGAAVPLLPIIFGSRAVWISILAAAVCMILMSAVLSTLSGMKLRERVFKNLAILLLTIGVTYAIGTLARAVFGIHA